MRPSLKKLIAIISIATIFSLIIACKTGTDEIRKDEYADYLQTENSAEEAFRVLIVSDRYAFVQTKYQDQIKRASDPEGDKSI